MRWNKEKQPCLQIRHSPDGVKPFADGLFFYVFFYNNSFTASQAALVCLEKMI